MKRTSILIAAFSAIMLAGISRPVLAIDKNIIKDPEAVSSALLNKEEQKQFSGILSEDTKLALDMFEEKTSQAAGTVSGKKSPVLAGLMSAVLPGAGELYAGSYWKALAFVAVEAAAVTANIYYNKKGDDATKEFEAFAEEHWSARRYAEWMNNFSAELNIKSDPIDLNMVDKHDYSEIRRAEEQVTRGGKAFSHKLPDYQSQQYYELIGKYHQYNHGWDDSDPSTAEWLTNLSPRFHQYAEMHIKPDETYYKYAQQATVVLVVNHVLSAIDAIWTTSRYNKKLELGMKMKTEEFLGMLDFYPQLNIKLNF